MDIIVENLYLKEVDKTFNINFRKRLNILQGSNGSGKSILLDYISGLRMAPEEVKIKGNNNIIYLNQNMYYNGRLRVDEYLKFIYNLNNIRDYKEYFFDFVALYLNDVVDEIKKMINKKMGDLSGGERRFIYNLIILSIDREWYILDEPLTAIDQNRKKYLIDIIVDYTLKGKGIILTSHETLDFYEDMEEDKIEIIEI